MNEKKTTKKTGGRQDFEMIAQFDDFKQKIKRSKCLCVSRLTTKVCRLPYGYSNVVVCSKFVHGKSALSPASLVDTSNGN